MFDNATITLNYKEFEIIRAKADKYDLIAKPLDTEEEFKKFDENPYKQTLDTMFDLLEEASKCKKADEKQFFIYETMVEYCKVFEIPLKKLMVDVPKGIETVNKNNK